MKIGLIDIEPKIFNTALMQIAYYHKSKGDTVEWAAPLDYDNYDKLYCSSLFDFTDKSQVPKRAICGGTGFDLTTKLPFDCDLDYSIYPKCKTSYFWFSRGCNRNCPWCVVRKKEGKQHSVRQKNKNPNGRYITVMDNSFFDNPGWKDAVCVIGRYPVDIQVDVRTLDEEKGKILNSMKLYKRIKIAWDDPFKDLTNHLLRLIKNIKPYKLMCYVLIGYWDNKSKDLYRVETLRDLGISPFVMPYNKFDPYQKKFARWVNHKAIFKTVKWEDYK